MGQVLPTKQPVINRTYFRNEGMYIIVGGLGGLGLELARWLLSRGAGHVILTSRTGPTTPYHHGCLRRWKEQGADVRVSTLNVTNREQAEQLLNAPSQGSSMSPWWLCQCSGTDIGQAGIAHRHMSDDVVIDAMALQTARKTFPAESGVDARDRVLLRYITHRPTARKNEGRRYQCSL
ncbi:fatty acid synthase [Caerostris extrusa]|uniref:Fatty acid synthase n=1 Tax=Caerostris extrusa TaxID=172846 RepID=A0AAV4SCK1_CAEEX|nr:fatty acid synthase [Caerostris extrusa]